MEYVSVFSSAKCKCCKNKKHLLYRTITFLLFKVWMWEENWCSGIHYPDSNNSSYDIVITAVNYVIYPGDNKIPT